MSPAVATTAERLPGLDGLKGLAIICVVAIHTAPGEGALWRDHVVNGVARLAVPLFLVVTGYLTGLRERDRSALAQSFVRFLRLHLIYGLFYWMVRAALDGDPGRLTPKGILAHFGEASFAGQFYFVILLQVFFVSAWLLPARFWRARSSVILAAALVVATLPWPTLAREWLGDAGPAGLMSRVLGSGSMLWLWLHYFTLGAWLGARESGAKRVDTSRGAAAILLLLGVAIALVGFPIAPWEDVSREPYARLSILIGASCLALALPALARWRAPAALQRLGADSFGVFVLHPAVLMIAFTVTGPPRTLPASLGLAALALGGAWLLARALRKRARWLLA